MAPAAGLDLPPLGESEIEIARYLAAVTMGVASGSIEARIADSLIAAARVALTAIKRVAEAREIEQLRSLLGDAQSIARGIQQGSTGDLVANPITGPA